MTPLIDDLRREEQLLTANLWARRLWPFGLALLMFLAGLFLGIRHRAPSQEDAKTVQALKDVSDSLKIVRAQNLALAHKDSLASAAAAAVRDSVAVHQPAVDRASAGVSVSTNPTDSSVIVQRKAPIGSVDSIPSLDTLANLPLPIATFIREAKPQLLRLTLAVHDLTAAGEVKDQRIAELVHGDSLWQRSDSLHVEHEKALQDEADSAFRRGAVKGVQIVVEVAVLLGGAIKLVRFIGH